MTNRVADAVVVLLALHTLVKFAVFFVVPYRRRRVALDHAYGDRPSATRTSDTVLLAISIGLSALLLWRGVDPVSLLGGFWIGATLIQLYFHRFHAPLAPEQAPPPVVSPIKTMSYAIQAAPQRSWRELLVMTGVIVCALIQMVRR